MGHGGRAMRRAIIMLALVATPALAATVQQDFDAAQALLDAGKASEARDAFTALLGRLAPNSQGMAANLVRARLGNALLATGDAEAAEPLLVTASTGFKGSDATSIEERGVALYDLGRAREGQGKIDSAAKAYAQVLDAKLFPANGRSDIGLRAALARTLIWSNPDEARRLLDGLLALPAESLGTTGDTRALLQTLRGRVELNNANAGEARRWFSDAARAAGGAETRRVTVADVRIRGDLALANYKLGKLDEVQKFIAYSGAGSLSAEGLTLAADMPLPACSPATSLAPDAVAVVEFAIGSDGRVSGVTPIYASRGSGIATPGVIDDGPEVQFPQAVRRWVWNTAAVAKLNPFWRQSVRVELRCFTRAPDDNPVSRSLARDTATWAQSAGLRPLPDLPANDAAALPVIRAELARREAADGAQSLQLVPALAAIAGNDAAPPKERAAARTRRVDLLVAAKAPPAVVDLARINAIFGAVEFSATRTGIAQVQRDGVMPILAAQESEGRGDSRMAMFTRLQLAEAHDVLKAPDKAKALLETIVAAPTSVLPEGDPIRTAALLRLSNIAAAARDSEGAARALAATGLSPEQCALIDVKPQPINATIGSGAFPGEAMRWGTGGYAKVGHDITADGQTANVRTIIAAPPFVFGPPTEKAVARFRYQPVFRPDNSIGCSGNVQTVRFVTPQ